MPQSSAKIMCLWTALLFPVMAKSQGALPENGTSFEPHISAKQMIPKVFLRYYRANTAVLVRDYCDKRKALWMGALVFYTDTTFEDSSVPMTYEGNDIRGGFVSSAAFVPGSRLVVVIDGMAFLHVLNSPTWVPVQGQRQFVTDVSTLHCCIDKEDWNCKKICNTVLLYNKASALDHQEVLLSNDGGYSFITMPLTSSAKEFLVGIYVVPTLASMVTLVVDSDKRFFFRHATPEDSSRRSDTYPLKDDLGLVQVIQVEGMKGHLVIWSPHMVLYSPNNGMVIVPVSEIEKENGNLPPPGLTVCDVATADTGVLAVITSDGGLYYGRLSLEAAVIKFPSRILSDMSRMVFFFDQYGDLLILQPSTFEQHPVSFNKDKMGVQEQLSHTTPAVIACPVERFSGNFDGKLFYIDIGGFVNMIVVYVPVPLCPFFPVVTLTNAEALIAHETIVEDGVTAEGFKKFLIDIDVRQLVTATGNRQNKVLSTITVDLMERKFSCNDLNPQKAHVISGCPPSKQIRVMRNTTACTRGTFTEEQLQDDFSYTIPKEVYDPELQFRPNMAKEDLTIKYSYTDFLCPLLVYHNIPWRPTFELWEGDTFVEFVKADFVMFEAHGMHNYQYLQTAKVAKCVSQPQDWISMLANQINPDPNTAWTSHNYRGCNDYNGPPLTNPNAEYQVLNKDSKNRIVFSNYNGMYIFKAVVVDPTYSYCSLTTTFTVYVYGAFPARILPSVVSTGIFVALFTVLLWIGYLLRQNLDFFHKCVTEHPTSQSDKH